ncbi:DUF302 domain-containing protein [Neochlamydia sp. S13]|uniref:DUF302 domain-containing protein n=1 Tax=Neochlamydia sp. S13 TaxID=1353976 RepID=UPI0005A79296|nr:DUF302 domain-containing protein [Neochlamydia sp. S13]BBI18287.1 Uncharacterized protein NCS13_2_0090 [Neochlamydia sp. S13]
MSLPSYPFIVYSSAEPPSKIIEKLISIINAKNVALFALIDHAEEALKKGLKLPYEQLLIFGDPKTGTLLMQENPAIGIELPLKILVWQNDEGLTQIGYKDPTCLAANYGIKENLQILQKMNDTLNTWVKIALQQDKEII